MYSLNKKEGFNKIRKQITNILGVPYFENDKCVLFCGNSLNLQSKINNEFVDLTITSPPYNIGKEYENRLSIQEYIEWMITWIKGTYNITKKNGGLLLNIGYINVENVARAIPIPYLIWDKVPYFLNQEIVWNYSAGVACKNYLSPRNEKILWYVKDQKEYIFNLDSIRDKNVKYPNSKKNGKLRVNILGKNPSDVWQIAKVTTGANRQSKERTAHPCQFPLDLIDRAVFGFSNEGDIIYDPFAGSGTTILSCLRNNRFCIAIEIREDYCSIIKKRIQEYSNKLL